MKHVTSALRPPGAPLRVVLCVGILLGLGVWVRGQEMGINRPGKDYRSFELPAADPALCKHACDEEAQCRAYTYVRPGVQGPAARCWLKSEVPSGVKDECCVSGVKEEQRAEAFRAGALAAFTPIQLPAPVAQPASRRNVGAAPEPPSPAPMVAAAEARPAVPTAGMPAATAGAGDADRLRRMLPPSPRLLALVTAPITRRQMIETLGASAQTRAPLEQAAASAGMAVSQLTAQMLNGTYAVDRARLVNAPPAQALLDLWKAPVHFSPTVPGPTYQAGGSTYAVGTTVLMGIYSYFAAPLQWMVQNDVATVFEDGYALIDIELPPGGGAYMFAIHVAAEESKSLVTQVGIPVAEAYVMSGRQWDQARLSLAPNSTGTALVGLFNVSPSNESFTSGNAVMARISIQLQVGMRTNVVFAGVTVTRL